MMKQFLLTMAMVTILVLSAACGADEASDKLNGDWLGHINGKPTMTVTIDVKKEQFIVTTGLNQTSNASLKIVKETPGEIIFQLDDKEKQPKEVKAVFQDDGSFLMSPVNSEATGVIVMKPQTPAETK